MTSSVKEPCSNNSEKFSILVSTCKAYEDVMINWIVLYKRLNSHLNYDIHIVSDGFINELPASINQIVFDSDDWQKRLSYALGKINTEYVLLFLEDYYFKGKVDLHEMQVLFDFVKDNDITYCKMNNIPRQNLTDGVVSSLDLSKRHAINLQLAVWSKSFLDSILTSGSAWALEDKLNNLSLDSIDESKFVTDNNSIIKLTNGIIKGKIDLKVNSFYKKEYSHILKYKDRSALSWLDYSLIYVKSKGRIVKNKKIRIILKKVFTLLGVTFVTKD
jgi:hypothetical protein